MTFEKLRQFLVLRIVSPGTRPPITPLCGCWVVRWSLPMLQKEGEHIIVAFLLHYLLPSSPEWSGSAELGMMHTRLVSASPLPTPGAEN